MTPQKLYRVRFCEWQTFAINIPASSPDNAITVAQAIRDSRGTLPFEEITGSSDDWGAEEIHPSDSALPILKKALEALNAVPRFPVGDSDSTAIAAKLSSHIQEIEGAAA